MRKLTRAPAAAPAAAVADAEAETGPIDMPAGPADRASLGGAAAEGPRRGTPGSAASRIVVAALVVGVAAIAVVAESGHGHSSAARLSSASAALRSGRSASGTRQAPAAAYSAPAVFAPVLGPSPAPGPARPARPRRGRPATGAPAAAGGTAPAPGRPAAPPALAPKQKAAPLPKKPAPKPKPRPAPPQATTITARGSVTCLSGSAVEGVWLVGLNGGSGWATWTASATSPQFATFSRSIPAGRWSVHVGCGGSPASWKEAIYSGWVSGTPHSFTCDDIPGQGQFGECSA
jgi:hypothetical protein